jgi:RNA polymerase sigma factor (sigma-70 family)
LNKKEYARIYYSDYHKLKKKGINFKFRKTKRGWHKIYFKKGKRIGYRYCDVVYGKNVIIDTMRRVGYDILASVMRGTVSYNSTKFIINGYSSADLCQFQYEAIFRNINKFRPERKFSIITFMSRCLHNAIINESKKHRTMARLPRIDGDRTKVAKVYPLDEGRVSGSYEKTFDRAISLADIRRVLEKHGDQERMIVELILRDGCSFDDAASAVGVLRSSKVNKMRKSLREDKELKGILK